MLDKSLQYHRKGIRDYPHELTFKELWEQEELCSGKSVEIPYKNGKGKVHICSVCNIFMGIGSNLTPIELDREIARRNV